MDVNLESIRFLEVELGVLKTRRDSEFVKSDSALSITEGCFRRRPRLTDRRGNLEDVVISSALTKIR